MNYPSRKIKKEVSNKINTSNRGMNLEFDINQTNQYYLEMDIANIHKKPTPIQIVKVDYPKRSAAKIIEAYFKLPSTTDYNGVYKGRYLDFEAKECGNNNLFPFSSIHPHQIKHLKSVIKQKGLCFIILRFTKKNETILIKGEKFINFYENTKRRSLPYVWAKENGHLIDFSYLKPVDYLKVVDKLLEEEENENK